MKYYEVKFTISAPQPMMQDACDLLAALAGEAGFETFEESGQGLTGYVQQGIFDQPQLEALLAGFPLPQCDVTFTVAEAEDRDWNEQWEQEGFSPIRIPMPKGELVIHDGRHTLEQPVGNDDLQIEIDARLAFGTGTHETTRLMVTELAATDMRGKRVLDCGTGTGILAIAALKLGAAEAVGYDIDEWSADNARHNAVINHVDHRLSVLLGDAAVLHRVEGTFDIVMANINRNILLADMPAFCSKLKSGGKLLLSGFFTSDIPLLRQKATELGLHAIHTRQEGEWAAIVIS